MSGFMGGWRNNDSLYGLILWMAKRRCTAPSTRRSQWLR